MRFLPCFLLLTVAACAVESTPGWRFEELRRYPAPEAGQGVAVDATFLYAISNHTVAQYRKDTGERVALWDCPAGDPLIHLNAGLVVEGRLYGAHSNFPGVPMVSSVEIWETAPLRHVGSHGFGRTDGSLTWIERQGAGWLACFVHYGIRGGESGRGPEWARVVEFDDEWRETGGWVFPPALVALVGARGFSFSGGAIGPGGLLYVTGHDEPALYVLDFPPGGSVLRWVATVTVPIEGQAFAWDPAQPGVVCLINRPTREIIVGRVSLPARPARP